MSAPDLTLEMMSKFQESGADKHVTLLLGAGASTDAGLPGWDELAIRLLLRSGLVENRKVARLLVDHQDPLLAAEAAKRSLGSKWNTEVQLALYENVVDPTPSALHSAAAGYLLEGDPAKTTLITLNFDTLLEAAIQEDPDISASSPKEEEKVQPHVVHHLHGEIDRKNEPREIALTLSDFNELVGKPDSWQQNLIKDCVQNGVVLIAGTSYRDPDLRRWLYLALQEQPRNHRAIVLLARQGFSLSRKEFEQVSGTLVAQWQAVGLEPIVVEEFSDGALIVRELRHINKPGYQAPQARSRKLWESHQTNFHLLQDDYVLQLVHDAERLKKLFSTDRLNLSLWLANGEKQIVRWASQDRVYKDPTQLRRVPSGHDTDWVAGRALGADDTRFQDLPENSNGRWGTVLATPLRVEMAGLPAITTAVLSIGLPGHAQDYEHTQSVWGEAILDTANDWGRRLGQVENSAGCFTLIDERSDGHGH